MVLAGNEPFYRWHEEKGRNWSERYSEKWTVVKETGSCPSAFVFHSSLAHGEAVYPRFPYRCVWGAHDHNLAYGI